MIGKTYSIDVETRCTVATCPHVGRSLCANKHSLNPWQSEITVIGVVADGVRKVFRGENKISDLRTELQKDVAYRVSGHNFKFDWIHIARHGFAIPLHRWVADSQLAAYVLTTKIPDSWLENYVTQAPAGTRKAGKHGLKTLAPYFLGVKPYWEAEAGSHDNDEYVLKDADYSKMLVSKLESSLKELGQFEFYQKQLEYAKLLLQAEWRGIAIDMTMLDKMEGELQQRSLKLEEELDELWRAGHQAYRSSEKAKLSERYEQMAAKANKPFTYGSRYWQLYENARSKLPSELSYTSPTQMTWLLRDYLGYDIQNLEGKDSTEAEVLERLAHQGHKDVATFLEWREVNKILTTYIPTYKELAVYDEDDKVFVIHPTYNPDVTRTGRTSSERPNMQNVPKALRPLFGARKGYKLVGFDMAAIEARLIALYSEDPKLYEIIKEDISIHDNNTKVFFELGDDVSYKDVKTKYEPQRAATKNTGFALFYHAGANRIRIAFAQKGFHFTLAQCKQIHKRFLTEYATAMQYAKEVVNAMEQGEVLNNLLGRPLSIENAEDAYMKAFNKLIQSSASDLLLESALRFKKGYDSVFPLLFVHDYVGFEVPDGDDADSASRLERCMTDYGLKNGLGPMPLSVEGGISQRWEK